MTDNSRKVLDYLKAHYGEKITAQQIQADLGFEKLASVTGSVNGLVRNGRAVRNEEVTGQDEKGKDIITKFITLTDAGLAFDPDAPKAE